MGTAMNDRIRRLQNQLALLASDAKVQLAYLSTGEIPGCIDELALDYGEAVLNAGFMLERGELNKAQYDCVKKLNEYLDEMSGQANAHVWTAEALHSTEVWREVRKMANECLKLFQ
jgi:hypothetical protein